MDGDLYIRMLGPVEITVNGESILPGLSAKSVAILCILLCNRQQKLTREKLSSMLWGDSFDTANYNLRYNLWNIKKVIPRSDSGEELILATKEFCTINPAYPVSSDIEQLQELERRMSDGQRAEPAGDISPEEAEQLLQIKQLLTGEFLEQFYIKGSDEFNEWVLFERLRYQRVALQTLKQLGSFYRQQGDRQSAVEILQSELAVNPYDEEIYFQLMELYLQMGQRHLAAMQYRKCESVLRKELNIAPQKKMRELYLAMMKEQEVPEAHTETPPSVLSVDLLDLVALEIPYLAVSELLEQLISLCSREILNSIPQVYLEDMALLQPSILSSVPVSSSREEVRRTGVPLTVRLLQSLRHFLQAINGSYRVLVRLPEKGVDVESHRWFAYLERIGLLMLKD